MPIPAFDGILGVLPPHLGDPRVSTDLSPYVCTVEEMCNRFGTTPERKSILSGFLNFREEMQSLGVKGFQWIDGSFVEDIETIESRAPGDIDVITFVEAPASPHDLDAVLKPRTELMDRGHVKATYRVDHFWISLGSSPPAIVDHTRYWCGLFSHRRDGAWKGMLNVGLRDSRDDDAARKSLLGGSS